ncbi:MAG: class I SAM-dependent methyltransferase [Dehalococcoidia bacterium]|nr:class I SAM-dependent methyltransferase [Dehalococcoidia bacterium]
MSKGLQLRILYPVKSENRLRRKLASLHAAVAFDAVYYLQLLQVFIRSLRPRAGSLLDSIRMLRLLYTVRDYTAILPVRLAALYRLSREIEKKSLSGDVVECGVYNGGSASVIASVCLHSRLDRRVWLFDSFEGLPKPTEKDGEKARKCFWWCHGDLGKVRDILARLQIPGDRVSIIKGWFQDTFPSVYVPEIALLHIDADWHDSVKLCLERFYDYVRPGGYIVIDDYGHWEGCSRATDDFLREKAPGVELVRVDYTGRYFRKP